MFQSRRKSGIVDAATGNLHLEIPLGSFPQRGGSAPLVPKLIYDSHIWTFPTDGSSKVWTTQGNLYGLAFGTWGFHEGGSAGLFGWLRAGRDATSTTCCGQMLECSTTSIYPALGMDLNAAEGPALLLTLRATNFVQSAWSSRRTCDGIGVCARRDRSVGLGSVQYWSSGEGLERKLSRPNSRQLASTRSSQSTYRHNWQKDSQSINHK